MSLEKHKLTFIKKTRPKIKIGDCFCINLGDLYFSGIVIHNQLIEKYGNDTMFSVLILNYSENKIENISIEKIETSIINTDLLIPPINLNKMGWTKGFLYNIGQIEIKGLVKKVVDSCMFFYGISTIYNMQYEEITSDIESFKLIGRSGIYNHIGLESLMQISLDLEMTESNPKGYNPYGYYDEIKNKYSNLEFPFWYYKAKKRLNL